MAPLVTSAVLVCAVLLVAVSSSRIDLGDCSRICAYRKILEKAGFSSDVVMNTGLCDCESIFSTEKRKVENEVSGSDYCKRNCKIAREMGLINCFANCHCGNWCGSFVENGKRASEMMDLGNCSFICDLRKFLIRTGFINEIDANSIHLAKNTELCGCYCKEVCHELNKNLTPPSCRNGGGCKCNCENLFNKRSAMMDSGDCSRICAFRRFLVKAGFPDDLAMNTGLCDCDPTFSTEKREKEKDVRKRNHCPETCAKVLKKVSSQACTRTSNCACGNCSAGSAGKRSEIERRAEPTKFNCTAHCLTNPRIQTSGCICIGHEILFIGRKRATYRESRENAAPEPMNCTEFCKKYPVNSGNCKCRSNMFVNRGRREEPTKMDCTKHCEEKKYSAGDCHCLSVWKKRPSYSEGNDGSRDFLLRELLKDYFLQNEENDEK